MYSSKKGFPGIHQTQKCLSKRQMVKCGFWIQWTTGPVPTSSVRYSTATDTWHQESHFRIARGCSAMEIQFLKRQMLRMSFHEAVWDTVATAVIEDRGCLRISILVWLLVWSWATCWKGGILVKVNVPLYFYSRYKLYVCIWLPALGRLCSYTPCSLRNRFCHIINK